LEQDMNFRRIAGPAALLLALATTAVCADPLAPARVIPDELKWEVGPTGNGRAYLVGDEKKPGVYVYRGKFQLGARVAPHFHPDKRVVTVLSGTLYMGYGEQFDEGAMKQLPAGSVWTEPARQAHFVWAKEGEVVIQVVGANGPSGVTRIEGK
jgi:quercetin dioxygenase-like cupin family protein